MSEKIFFNIFGLNKTLINPINNNEVFNCNDILRDLRKCRIDAKQGKKTAIECAELKSLGRSCFTLSDKDFKFLLAKKYETKLQYLEYLKENGSVLYNVYLNDPSTFSISVYHEQVAKDLAFTLNTEIIENNKITK